MLGIGSSSGTRDAHRGAAAESRKDDPRGGIVAASRRAYRASRRGPSGARDPAHGKRGEQARRGAGTECRDRSRCLGEIAADGGFRGGGTPVVAKKASWVLDLRRGGEGTHRSTACAGRDRRELMARCLFAHQAAALVFVGALSTAPGLRPPASALRRRAHERGRGPLNRLANRPTDSRRQESRAFASVGRTNRRLLLAQSPANPWR
jgi:hypothetical protein